MIKIKTVMPCMIFKKFMAMLLSALMVFYMLSPNMAYAVGSGELVLKSVSHRAVGEATIEGSKVTFKLPFGNNYEPLELKNLNCTLNSGFVLKEITFPNDNSKAEVNGSSVIMDVSYTYTSGEDTTTVFSTQYYVNVITGQKPTFSGTISKSTTLKKNVVLYYSDFVNNYNKNDGKELGFISIGAVSSNVGKLKFNGSDYIPGTLLNVTDMASGKLIFEPLSIGTISFSVTAYANDENKTNCGNATLTIKVDYPVASDITFNGTEDKLIVLNSSQFIDACRLAVGGTFDKIKFDALPATSNGKLIIGYVSSSYYEALVSANVDYNSANIDKMSLMPYTDYSGNFTISYRGYNTNGDVFLGKIKFVVADVKDVADNIKYATKENVPLKFSLNNFVNACTQTVGGTLDYIKIPTLPSSSNGKLYIDYVSSSSYGSVVSASTAYNKANIDKMSFVPYNDYFGTINIPYNGYNTAGDMFTGKIEITVIENPVDADTITYSTYENTPVDFDSDDFADECKDTTGEALDYVKFTLPSSSRGKLYVNYVSDSSYGAKVSASTKYYENDLDDITFVPYEDYYGTVTISYVGYNDDGEDYTGEIEIKVIEVDVDADPIVYETGSYTPIELDSDDFQDACDDVTNEDLDYVKFTIPSSTYGVMYTDYTSSTRYGSKVSSSTKYYYDELDDITFVPKSSYVGNVFINYTGYNEDGESFTGVVKIIVEKENPVADVINITTKEDNPLSLDDEDFNRACEDTTGEELDYVKFTLPSSSYGKLYYNYTSANNYGSLVSSSTKYYYDDTPSLSKVDFVPYKDYYGDVTIKYTGYNVDGDAFNGTIEIEVVSMPETEGSVYFKDVTKDYSWAASQIDSLYEKKVVSGIGNGNYGPSQNMSRGDFMLMIYRALDLTANTSGNFSDVPKDSYYYKAIATAKALGIAKGSNNMFMPTSSITREDAFVLVDRALRTEGTRLSVGDYDDLSQFKDRKTVSDYAVTSVATLVKAGIIKGTNSNINPKAFISRAEMAIILYRVLELE